MGNIVTFAELFLLKPVMPNQKNEWYIIVNPRAGSGKTMSEWVPAENRLIELGVPHNTVYTTHKHHAHELAATAARLGYRKILAVGGDGSLHEVFDGIVNWCFASGTDPEDFYVAVVPIGSGNDWIKTFAVPNNAKEVASLIADESFGKQDIIGIKSDGGKITYMANIGGVGFDSHVCERVNRQKERGLRSKRIYLDALLHTIRWIRAINLEIIADEKSVFSGKCYSVALGNGKYSGGRFRQTPLADPCDGIVDCLIVPRLPMWTLLKELPHLVKGDVHECENVIYVQARNIRIVPLDSRSADILEVDGEIEGKMPLDVNVTGRHINVLVGKTYKRTKGES